MIIERTLLYIIQIVQMTRHLLVDFGIYVCIVVLFVHVTFVGFSNDFF